MLKSVMKIYISVVILLLISSTTSFANSKSNVIFKSECHNYSKSVFDFEGEKVFSLQLIIDFEDNIYFKDRKSGLKFSKNWNELVVKLYDKASKKKYFKDKKFGTYSKNIRTTLHFKNMKELKEFYSAEEPQIIISYKAYVEERVKKYRKDMSFKNNKVEWIKTPYISKSRIWKTKKLVYDISFNTDLDKELNDCESRYIIDKEKDKKNNITEIVLSVLSIVAFVIFMIFLVKIVKYLYVRIKEKSIKYKNSLKNTLEDNKIRRIAEEESIRQSVKKSIDRKSSKEVEELQELINEAVSNGDNKTAQVLLKLLKKKEADDENE